MTDDYAAERAEVGRRITEAMGDRKQEAVAQRLGVSQPTVGRWMRGANLPDPVRLRQLADLLGVPAAWLMQPLFGEVSDPEQDELLGDLAAARRRLDRLESRLRGLPAGSSDAG